jgi:hypothetical protein
MVLVGLRACYMQATGVEVRWMVFPCSSSLQCCWSGAALVVRLEAAGARWWRLRLCRASSGNGVAEGMGSGLMAWFCACGRHDVESNESFHWWCQWWWQCPWGVVFPLGGIIAEQCPVWQVSRSLSTLRWMLLSSVRWWIRRAPHALSFKVVCTNVVVGVLLWSQVGCGGRRSLCVQHEVDNPVVEEFELPLCLAAGRS